MVSHLVRDLCIWGNGQIFLPHLCKSIRYWSFNLPLTSPSPHFGIFLHATMALAFSYTTRTHTSIFNLSLKLQTIFPTTEHLEVDIWQVLVYHVARYKRYKLAFWSFSSIPLSSYWLLGFLSLTNLWLWINYLNSPDLVFLTCKTV